MTPQVEVETLPNCRVKLQIRVSKEQAAVNYDNAIKQVNKRVSLPGFRKGKAPRNVIEKQYGDDLQKEWRKIVLHSAINEAVQSIEQKPLTNELEKATLNSISLDEGASIEVLYETEPVSPAIDMTGFKLQPTEKKTVTADDVEKTISQLRNFHAEWNTITDRPVQMNDQIALEMVRIDEPSIVVADHWHVKLEKGETPDWMLEALVGAKVGEPVTATSRKPEKSEEESPLDSTFSFKPAKFQLTVQEIREPKLPPLDEAFFKKLGVDGLDQLKERVHKNLENESDLFEKGDKRHQLEDWLLTHYPIEVPPTLLQREVNILATNYAVGLVSRGVSEEWIRENNNEIFKSSLEYAKKRLQLIYILRRTAKDRDVKVMSDELNREMIYEQLIRPPQERITSKEMHENEVRARIYFALLNDRTLDSLLSTT